MLQECASFISAPDRSINFINQRTLIAGTQRPVFDLMRLGRRNVNQIASFDVGVQQAACAKSSRERKPPAMLSLAGTVGATGCAALMTGVTE
jgi:hypothetical protein